MPQPREHPSRPSECGVRTARMSGAFTRWQRRCLPYLLTAPLVGRAPRRARHGEEAELPKGEHQQLRAAQGCDSQSSQVQRERLHPLCPRPPPSQQQSAGPRPPTQLSWCHCPDSAPHMFLLKRGRTVPLPPMDLKSGACTSKRQEATGRDGISGLPFHARDISLP